MKLNDSTIIFSNVLLSLKTVNNPQTYCLPEPTSLWHTEKKKSIRMIAIQSYKGIASSGSLFDRNYRQIVFRELI